ncbi:hypothetical protein L484_002818 [Morus notabilis]|uniref:Uncharacterized protein n=1 Tax=Morus notabilis TaxID=981085 RepID=W9RNX4_9ROSA|nr:hypothetical protein L484_002818 [Morus notabilis]
MPPILSQMSATGLLLNNEEKETCIEPSVRLRIEASHYEENNILAHGPSRPVSDRWLINIDSTSILLYKWPQPSHALLINSERKIDHAMALCSSSSSSSSMKDLRSVQDQLPSFRKRCLTMAKEYRTSSADQSHSQKLKKSYICKG